MAIETMPTTPTLTQIQPTTEGGGRNAPRPSMDTNAAADFRNALDRAGGLASGGLGSSVAATPLNAAVGMAPLNSTPNALKFSAHAIERMRSRGISFAPEMMKGIENAVQKAAQKGSKDTLVLTGDSALIVSVKNNTVVTVMDKASMRENVFTNIDSTVVI